MRFKLALSKNELLGALLVLLLVSLSIISLTGSFQKADAVHSCIEGVEVAVHTNESSVSLDPYELESACMSPSGSLTVIPYVLLLAAPMQ